MTSIINAAHQKHSRVTLTISVFAWTSGQVAVQKALLGSAAARLNLARQAVAAVRDRGADGINLDFEPLVSGYEDEFVALVRTIRAELNKVARRLPAHVRHDGLPRQLPARGGRSRRAAPTRSSSWATTTGPPASSYAGSIDPLAGPGLRPRPTRSGPTPRRVSAVEGDPGRPVVRPRLVDGLRARVNARTQTGAKYGYCNAVNYTVAVDYVAEHGRR